MVLYFKAKDICFILTNFWGQGMWSKTQFSLVVELKYSTTYIKLDFQNQMLCFTMAVLADSLHKGFYFSAYYI